MHNIIGRWCNTQQIGDFQHLRDKVRQQIKVIAYSNESISRQSRNSIKHENVSGLLLSTHFILSHNTTIESLTTEK